MTSPKLSRSALARRSSWRSDRVSGLASGPSRASATRAMARRRERLWRWRSGRGGRSLPRCREGLGVAGEDGDAGLLPGGEVGADGVLLDHRGQGLGAVGGGAEEGGDGGVAGELPAGVEVAEDREAAEAGEQAVAVGAARLGEGVDLDRHAQAGLRIELRSSRVASGSRAVRSRVSEASSISARGMRWMVSGIGAGLLDSGWSRGCARRWGCCVAVAWGGRWWGVARCGGCAVAGALGRTGSAESHGQRPPGAGAKRLPGGRQALPVLAHGAGWGQRCARSPCGSAGSAAVRRDRDFGEGLLHGGDHEVDEQAALRVLQALVRVDAGELDRPAAGCPRPPGPGRRRRGGRRSRRRASARCRGRRAPRRSGRRRRRTRAGR